MLGPKPWPHEWATHTDFQAKQAAEKHQLPAQPSLAVQPAAHQILPGASFDFPFLIWLCSPGCLHTHKPSASASRILWLQVWAKVPNLEYFLNALDLYVKFHTNQAKMLPSRLTSIPCPYWAYGPCVIRVNSHWCWGHWLNILHHIVKSHGMCIFKSFFSSKILGTLHVRAHSCLKW